MPESSSPSVESISEQDYISKTVATTLLQELLKEVVIDEEVKNTLLEKFSQNLEESFQNPEWVQELSLTFEEVEEESPLEEVERSSPLDEVERSSASILGIRLLRCNRHSIHWPPPPPISPSPIPLRPRLSRVSSMPRPEFGTTGAMMERFPVHTPDLPPIHTPPLPPDSIPAT